MGVEVVVDNGQMLVSELHDVSLGQRDKHVVLAYRKEDSLVNCGRGRKVGTTIILYVLITRKRQRGKVTRQGHCQPDAAWRAGPLI